MAGVAAVLAVPQVVQVPEPAQRTMPVSGSVTIENQPGVRVVNVPQVTVANSPTVSARQAGDWSVSPVGALFLEPGTTYRFSWIGSERAEQYRVIELRRDGWIQAEPVPPDGGSVWLNPSAAAVIEED